MRIQFGEISSVSDGSSTPGLKADDPGQANSVDGDRPGPDRRELERSIHEMCWTLGRSLLLIWLHRNQRCEPFFITEPIASCRLLGRDLMRGLVRLDSTGKESPVLRKVCRMLAVDAYLDDDALFRSGIEAVERVDWRTRRGTRKHARCIHLLAFVHRAHSDNERYAYWMHEFERILRHFRGNSQLRRRYQCRWLYERASALLHAESEPDVRGALRLFRQAFDVAWSQGRKARRREACEHILYGALRNELHCCLLLHEHASALTTWKKLESIFPAMMSLLPRDAQLLSDLRQAASLDPVWHDHAPFVLETVGRVMADDSVSCWTRRFLSGERKAWQRLRNEAQRAPGQPRLFPAPACGARVIREAQQEVLIVSSE